MHPLIAYWLPYIRYCIFSWLGLVFISLAFGCDYYPRRAWRTVGDAAFAVVTVAVCVTNLLMLLVLVFARLGEIRLPRKNEGR